ncbi:hypothetical protein Ddc_11125 [Ditylenchus destructor]|nr:hypothetical protein Ddc_11125 [Ditylenchus destructor]
MVPSAPLFKSLFQRLTVALSVPTRGLRPLDSGFVSANSRPSAARSVALSVPTRGLRPLDSGFVSANSRPSAARTVALSVPTRGLRPLDSGFVSANSRPSAARMVALSVPTRGLRPLEWWLCQCQLAAFGRSTVALSVPSLGSSYFFEVQELGGLVCSVLVVCESSRRSAPRGPTNDQHTAHLSAELLRTCSGVYISGKGSHRLYFERRK